jgi:predicted NUDIX family NTP pyrophosphohydrolase
MEWPPRSGKTQNFSEIDRVAYFSVTRARRKILPGQRAFIDELIRYLKADGKSA